jgi:aryl-alcohol dehydrogenase-like predicted oxidoreductase
MTLVPYFPLASGLLTGKYRRGATAPDGTRLALLGDERWEWGAPIATVLARGFDLVERLEDYARGHGHTLLELALSWLAGVPAVPTVIAGARTAEQVRANARATSAWSLTDVERGEVDALTEGAPRLEYTDPRMGTNPFSGPPVAT